MDPLTGNWQSTTIIGYYSYTCGYCSEKTGVRDGFKEDSGKGRIYICGGCNRPTFFEEFLTQTPAPILGNVVIHLPEMIDSLYLEARLCTQVEAYTACVLTCRKILMHVAVEQGAETNQNFLQYVEYLADSGYVPPHGRGWVDHIRTRSNEANHEIVLMSKDAAFELLSFVELLLKFVFELPARVMPTDTTNKQFS